ncbi:hypothetical protein [Gracilibacillus orientalis]|uniref:hypothetical protein n=1 Tax=Gracilibacillus orientalis TaxID=334253 RepID=UPI000B81BC43|nr:hypothetical protein [Gracilibacillus orientalis]
MTKHEHQLDVRVFVPGKSVILPWNNEYFQGTAALFPGREREFPGSGAFFQGRELEFQGRSNKPTKKSIGSIFNQCQK